DFLAREAVDEGVETAAEAAVRRHDDEKVNLVLARAAQKEGTVVANRDVADEAREHFGHLAGIGPAGLRLLLGAAQLAGRDHLHGRRYLPRGFHAGDAGSEVLKAWHPVSIPFKRPFSKKRRSRRRRRRSSAAPLSSRR